LFGWGAFGAGLSVFGKGFDGGFNWFLGFGFHMGFGCCGCFLVRRV
jgi:hypothetical protein